MLTRPGSPHGPAWLRRLNDRVPGPTTVDPRAAGRQRRAVWFWLGWAVLMGVGFWANDIVAAAPARSYESSIRIAGLPLLAYGQTPTGIVAVGGVPTGVIAIGGAAIGIIAFGGVAAGGLALSGVSAGIVAVGGWAFGGGAIGYYAFGGLAVGGYAYAGNGVALGYHEASGRQKERLFG